MNQLPPLPCYLNGTFTLLPDAKISVMDRGFIFGDGIYEVVPVYGGQPFRFEQHMARMERSLVELRIANPLSRTQWLAIANQLITAYAQTNGLVASDSDQLAAGGIASTSPAGGRSDSLLEGSSSISTMTS